MRFERPLQNPFLGPTKVDAHDAQKKRHSFKSSVGCIPSLVRLKHSTPVSVFENKTRSRSVCPIHGFLAGGKTLKPKVPRWCHESCGLAQSALDSMAEMHPTTRIVTDQDWRSSWRQGILWLCFGNLTRQTTHVMFMNVVEITPAACHK